MALNTVALSQDLLDLFTSPPASAPLCADAWAGAMASYAQLVIPPSTSVQAASLTLGGTLSSLFQVSPGLRTVEVFANQLEAAFLIFATSVGGGMPGYVPTPPAGSIGFLNLLQTTQPTHASAAAAWSTAIDSWMRTGFSTLAVTPFTVVPWT